VFIKIERVIGLEGCLTDAYSWRSWLSLRLLSTRRASLATAAEADVRRIIQVLTYNVIRYNILI